MDFIEFVSDIPRFTVSKWYPEYMSLAAIVDDGISIYTFNAFTVTHDRIAGIDILSTDDARTVMDEYMSEWWQEHYV